MINGNFLRRIEPRPSYDLAERTDLLLYQTVVDLTFRTWSNLIYPEDDVDDLNASYQHARFIADYTTDIDTKDVDFLIRSIELPVSCKNIWIYNLCLINRIRRENDRPLITFSEDEWQLYAIYREDPKLESKFETFFLEHLNG